MPNWNDLLNQIRAEGAESAHDRVRRRHLQRLFKYTQRNVIVYYSGWLRKSKLARSVPVQFGIVDDNKNGFIACVHKMDRSTAQWSCRVAQPHLVRVDVQVP